MIYLDANSGEMLRPSAREAMLAAWQLPGNPSSVHQAGRAARALMEASREAIASAVGAQARYLVFTSGGTEADGLALRAMGSGRRLLVGATEHDAVRTAAAGGEVLPVDRNGVVRLAELERRLRAEGPALVALMLANNETGVVYPIAAAAELCRAHGARLHTDAVQALGRMAIDIGALGADSIALSAHKAGGPKGIGALVMAEDFPAAPLIAGGGQEKGWRGGTQNLPAIAGFAAICGVAPPDHLAMRDRIGEAAKEVGAIIAGEQAERLPNTLCLILPGVRADLQLITLDLAGFAVSAGAACSSGKVAKSHVLEAMGFGADAGSAIRVSLSWQTDQAQIEQFIAAYQTMARRLLRSKHT